MCIGGLGGMNLFNFLKSRICKGKVLNDGDSFANVMDLIESLESKYSKEEQIIVIDFVMEIIRRDLQYDILTTVLYEKEHFEKSLDAIPFPLRFYDQDENELRIKPCDDYKTIDLSSNCVLSMPWHRYRLLNAILNLRNQDFIYDEKNHMSYYIPELEITIVYNGFHSTGVGIGFSKGNIRAQVLSIRSLFNHVITDGLYWYNKHTKEKLEQRYGELRVEDFRFGVLYELARKKYAME